MGRRSDCDCSGFPASLLCNWLAEEEEDDEQAEEEGDTLWYKLDVLASGNVGTMVVRVNKREHTAGTGLGELSSSSSSSSSSCLVVVPVVVVVAVGVIIISIPQF